MREYNVKLENSTVLVTGAAGFIGCNLTMRLLNDYENIKVVGIDNMNDYYDVRIKDWRLEQINKVANGRFEFVRGDISDKELIDELFEKHSFAVVVNLAAQAGVRYSIDHPDAYIQSNLIGFYNILEACRHNPVEHLVYASSSSVYGGNKKVPFSTDDKVDNPVSLYQLMKLGFPVLCIDRLSQIKPAIAAILNWSPGTPFPEGIGARIPELELATLPAEDDTQATDAHDADAQETPDLLDYGETFEPEDPAELAGFFCLDGIGDGGVQK